MCDDLIERLSCLHQAATPAEMETAEIKEGENWFCCPHCDGAGEVEADQYINYDGVAANVLFSGIGHEFGANRDWYMEVTRAWPSVSEEITRLRARLEQAERERDEWAEKAMMTPSADNTTTVAEAAKVICDAWDADTLPVNDPDPMLPSFIAALRALAAQKGE